MCKLRFLNGNMLKIIAALSMLIDHIGVFLFPEIEVLRYIGRLAFPIFAFMISEGARYTRNKVNYVLGIATLAFSCQIVVYYYDNRNLTMSILVTFSLSILIIYALQGFKKEFFSGNRQNAFSAAWLLLAALIATYVFTRFFNVDYGYFGVLTPVFASLFDFKDIDAPQSVKRLDKLHIRILTMGLLLLIFAILTVPSQYFALIAIFLLLFYSEKRGNVNIKYFFYVFYPLHIFILEGISLILE